MSESQPQTVTIDPNNMTPQQAFVVMWRCLNKAQQKGVFTFDESYALKLSAEKLAQELKMVQQEQPVQEQSAQSAQSALSAQSAQSAQSALNV
jgi:glutathione synthase/RimK-type ligase-like ATP-grasp enzyme